MSLSNKNILNKIILVSVKYYNSKNELINRYDFSGTVISVDSQCISIKKTHGGIFTLPPCTSHIISLEPGEYKSSSTGEIIKDPDFYISWNLYPNDI